MTTSSSSSNQILIDIAWATHENTKNDVLFYSRLYETKTNINIIRTDLISEQILDARTHTQQQVLATLHDNNDNCQ